MTAEEIAFWNDNRIVVNIQEVTPRYYLFTSAIDAGTAPVINLTDTCWLKKREMDRYTTAQLRSEHCYSYSATHKEKQPRYPGGEAAWQRFLIKHIILPDSVNTEYSVASLQFLVDRKGNLSHVQMIKGDPGLRDMFERLLLQSGQWLPAMQGGRTVKAYKRLTIRYCL